MPTPLALIIQVVNDAKFPSADVKDKVIDLLKVSDKELSIAPWEHGDKVEEARIELMSSLEFFELHGNKARVEDKKKEVDEDVDPRFREIEDDN